MSYLFEQSNGVPIIGEHYNMDLASEATVLQLAHINLLRKSEYLVFRHGKDNVPAHIQGHVKTNVRGMGEVEKDIYIVVSDSHITNYGRRTSDNHVQVAVRNYASYMLGFATMHDNPWRTIVGLLRVGDTLELAWTAGNNNQVMENFSLHADSLELIVNRRLKKSAFPGLTPKYRFLIATEVSPDNTARMCKAF